MPTPRPDSTLIVACLCAAWCRLCDDYQAVLREVAADLSASGLELQWFWLDIEDEADLLGDFDVETFPTLVVVDRQQLRFAGPLTPQPATLRRLLRALLAAPNAPPLPAQGATGEAQAFAERLHQRLAGDGPPLMPLLLA